MKTFKLVAKRSGSDERTELVVQGNSRYCRTYIHLTEFWPHAISPLDREKHTWIWLENPEDLRRLYQAIGGRLAELEAAGLLDRQEAANADD